VKRLTSLGTANTGMLDFLMMCKVLLPTNSSKALLTPYGSQEAISETGHLRRRQQQEKQYYHSIIEKLSHRDGIYIMGPSKAKIGLEQEMNKEPRQSEKILAVESCGRITDNQIKAKVRDFFKDK